MVKISVIVPAYNEAQSLPLLLESINKFFVKNKVSGETVLVNDGSTDNSREVLRNLEKEYKFLRVIHHKKNLGLTEALITCFREAKGEELVFLPSDLESNPEADIPKLLNEMNKGYDVVCGYRTNRVGFKKFASAVYNWLSRWLFKVETHDLNWIKAFRRDVVKDMPLRSGWHRYIPLFAKANGYKIGEVKTLTRTRPYGVSKFGKGRLLVGLLDLLVVKFHVSFIDRPMTIFGSLGLLFSSLGFLGLLYMLYIKISTGVIGYRIPFLLLVILLFVTGVQLFAIGFIAEYLTTIRERLK
ncbi:MAG: glycosyltransferase family 2 protein [archaeon]